MKRHETYSPEGEMFEVSPRLAKKLVVDHGWRFSKEEKPAFKEDEKHEADQELKIKVDFEFELDPEKVKGNQ